MRKPRRNDSQWRADCIEAYGEQCMACGSRDWIQMDHIMPRAHGGQSVIENGLPLCRRCHEAKTNSQLQIKPEWLTPHQKQHLAEKAWVFWGTDGTPYGRGWRHFAAEGGGA